MQLLTAGDGEVQTNETTISTPRGLSIHAAAVLVENVCTNPPTLYQR